MHAEKAKKLADNKNCWHISETSKIEVNRILGDIKVAAELGAYTLRFSVPKELREIVKAELIILGYIVCYQDDDLRAKW